MQLAWVGGGGQNLLLAGHENATRVNVKMNGNPLLVNYYQTINYEKRLFYILSSNINSHEEQRRKRKNKDDKYFFNDPVYLSFYYQSWKESLYLMDCPEFHLLSIVVSLRQSFITH